jgi:hypothetical protein
LLYSYLSLILNSNANKTFLKKNELIAKEISGFRQHRQIKDNIFMLTQLSIQALNKKRKNLVIFFDISKAFDKVWQNGFLFKMKQDKFWRL